MNNTLVCISCQSGYHCDPASKCGCPCHGEVKPVLDVFVDISAGVILHPGFAGYETASEGRN